MPDTIVLTQDDVFALFGEHGKDKGYVYFDDVTSRIGAVSDSIEQDLLERFSVAEVDSSFVRDVFAARANLDQWLVCHDGTKPVLQAAQGDLRVHVTASGRPVRNVLDGSVSPVRLVIIAPPGSSKAVIKILCSDGVNLTADFEPVSLVIARKGDSDDVFAVVTITPEIFEAREQFFTLARRIEGEIDVITSPLRAVSYSVEKTDSLPVAMPKGRFDDLQRYAPMQHVVDAALIVEIHDDFIQVRLNEGGGKYYERSIRALMVSVTEREDREAMLWYGAIPLASLRNGPVKISHKITQALADIEVVGSRYFLNNFVTDCRSDYVETNPIPLDGVTIVPLLTSSPDGVRVVLDAVESVAKVQVVGSPRLRDNVFGTLSLVNRDAHEIVYFHTNVELGNNKTFDLPKSVWDEDFVIIMTRFSDRVYHILKTKDRFSKFLPKRASDSEGLRVTIDPIRGKMRFDKVGNPTMLSSVGTVSLVDASNEDVILFTATVDLAIDSIIDIPPTADADDYLVAMSRVCEDAYWAEGDISPNNNERLINGRAGWMAHAIRANDLPPCLLAYIHGGFLRVFRYKNGGDAAPVDSFSMTLCREQDPETIICRFQIDNAELNAGEMLKIPLPLQYHPELANSKIEIMVDNVYTSAYLVDKPYDPTTDYRV